ncbi:MAG: hypothetical protein UT30_C0001G0013 [Candidatus Uhrbacteria bacterium GW2011_GWF2_39_13]|uniref:Uncharacterized protein n=1 Tax=Candidatus Uhrbacteria bacterium GW2011_GWF2_39_13 TaxID=1618995 RepID=A0A0G0MLV6_9BACT|nr:MAG: hypothetical protein UT30_C0001G0013 [Candidatus Uhrbacteria bacterium GW2011_GWF2_39_13]HAU66337.1 hypothetical protein [Candidatus Uhrbacteria bacterium]
MDKVIAENYGKTGLSVSEKTGFEAMAQDYLARGVVIMELNEKLDACRHRLPVSRNCESTLARTSYYNASRSSLLIFLAGCVAGSGFTLTVVSVLLGL